MVNLHEGVVLPRGLLYRFVADGPEPIVLLRVSAVIDTCKDPLMRTVDKRQDFDGYAQSNHEVPCVFS